MAETIDGIIDAQFKELFEDRGRPSELNEDFTKTLFQRIQEGTITGGNNSSSQRTTVVINNGRGLAEAIIASANKNLRFAVTQVEDASNLKAVSQSFGEIDETAAYGFSLKNVDGNFVRLSLTLAGSDKRVEVWPNIPL
ncbi:hypothetical protein RhiTH_003265 [Rhizoctonia solani]|uniref:Uncharacterized protein n=1 Tax=Rhizoctonia solani TaxID=456999 RepID=A0A8H7M2E1_9AGAM|nr:hypothetical protein RHS01_08010 [Rhizoctonia solani]